MATSRRVRRGHKGFTLFELLLVIGLIALLSSVAIPMSNSIAPFMLNKGVSQVEHALKFARSHAKAMGAPTIVRFDSATRSVQVTIMEEGAFGRTEVPAMHPLNKTAYNVALDSQPLTAASIKLRAEFSFRDGSKAPYVAFDTSGAAGRLFGNTLIPIQEPGTWRGSWRSAEGYAAGDWVEHDKILYDCLSSHTSGSSFASDLSTNRWKVRTSPGQVTVSAGPHQRHLYVEPNWGFVRVQPK